MVGWSMSFLPDYPAGYSMGPATMKGGFVPFQGRWPGGDRWLIFLYVVDTGDKLLPI